MLILLNSFKKQRVYAVLNFKQKHQVSLVTGSGLQQNEGQFPRELYKFARGLQ